MSAVNRLLAGYACGAIAVGLPWPLLLVLVWDQYGEGPHGAWALGLTAAARMAPYVLCSWAVGSLGDHVRRDRLVRVTMLLRFVLLAAGAVAVAADRPVLGVVAAALAVLAGTPTYPAVAAALPELAGPHRTRATEVLVTAEVSSWVVGPAVGGVLLAAPLRDWTLPMAAGLTMAGLVWCAGVAVPGPAERAPDSVAGMVRAVRGCPPALAALGLAALLNLVLTLAGLTLLPLSEEVWRTGETGFGVATACVGFGALGAPLLSRVASGALTGPIALGVALGVVALTPVPWPALPVLVLAGATGVLVESRATRTLQDVVADHYRAGALGLMDSVMVGACLVASLVAPLLTQAVGARTALGLVAALAASLVLVGPYDAVGDRPAARPDPRGTPAVGGTPLG